MISSYYNEKFNQATILAHRNQKQKKNCASCWGRNTVWYAGYT